MSAPPVTVRWSPLERLGFEVAASLLFRAHACQMRVLRVLIQHAGETVPAEDLTAAGGRFGVPCSRACLRVHVSRLRDTLEANGLGDPVRSVRGRGYEINPVAAGMITHRVEASL